jgi:hypothetical protein
VLPQGPRIKIITKTTVIALLFAYGKINEPKSALAAVIIGWLYQEKPARFVVVVVVAAAFVINFHVLEIVVGYWLVPHGSSNTGYMLKKNI